MIADRLRAAILQAAISGKLTDQRPEDGTATELLEQIKAKRAALVKAKKLKKQKPLPPITDEDRPFPIPSNWVWARFGEAARYAQRGKSPTYADISPYLAVSQKCVRWTGFDPALARPYASEAFAALPQDRILSAGDILWNSTGTGTVGRSTVLPESGDFGKMAADSHVTVIRTFPEVLPRFIDAFISSPHIQQNMDDLTSGTTKQQELNLGTILELPLPIPPLAEQERVVAKLDEVLPLIDQLAELEREREYLDREFAKAIERAILQAAISGKLTDQRPEDGTAEELIETIKNERQQLEKEGKIKKQKPLPPVDKTDEPFDLPDSWVWSRLGRVFNMQAGKNVAVGNISEVGEYPCYGGNGIRGYVADYNRDGTYPIIGRQGALCGNINVASGRFFATEHAVVVETFGHTSPAWAALALEQLNLNQYATATAQPGLSVEKLKVVPVPVPPVDEQERIAAKLDRALPLARGLGELVS
ncbi:restriction endonuclease subunit S [Actinomyces sp.]